MADVVRSPGSIDLSDLKMLVEALEHVAEEVDGYGELESARILIAFDETKVVCRYDKSQRDWEVRIA